MKNIHKSQWCYQLPIVNALDFQNGKQVHLLKSPPESKHFVMTDEDGLKSLNDMGGDMFLLPDGTYQQWFGITLSQGVKNLRTLRRRLDAMASQAENLGLVLQNLPEADEPSNVTCSSDVGAWVSKLLNRFYSINASVWLAEESLEAPSEANKPVRSLGKEMHRWYELFKLNVGFPLCLPRHEDPTFMKVFKEGMRRMNQPGEKYASEYMKNHWGMSLGASMPKQG
jgi:hypothetical protein